MINAILAIELEAFHDADGQIKVVRTTHCRFMSTPSIISVQSD